MVKKTPCLSTLRRKAAKAGYTLSKGYRRYNNRKWGYVRDTRGNKIIGYMLFNNETGCYVWQSYTELFEYYLSFEQIVSLMREMKIL